MYFDSMLSVGKVENGFMLETRVRLVPEAKATAKMACCCCSPCGSSSVEKQYIAKDKVELAQLITDILPLLDADYKTESEFDSAFDKAVGDMDQMEKEMKA